MTEKTYRDFNYLNTSLFTQRGTKGLKRNKKNFTVDQSHRFRVPSVLVRPFDNLTTEELRERDRLEMMRKINNSQ
jgi:hypothetical protein